MQIEIFHINSCEMIGCYEQRLEITNMNLNLFLEYQSEQIFIKLRQTLSISFNEKVRSVCNNLQVNHYK